ncbi:MAG: transglutaminase domain-containing protein [Parcubacteria group bacterium]|nr:transglutaminase domain-containing protein [Parcubacteria group bacterium]
MNKYLQFGKYTSGCPSWLLNKVKKIKNQKVNRSYVEAIFNLILEEFNPTHHSISITKDFKKSRFISVSNVLKKRQASCGSLATVVASTLRNLKIPTKIINGFLGSEIEGARHAWNEIYLSNRWVSFDITRPQKKFKISKDYIKKDEWVDFEELEEIYKIKS